MAGSVICVHFPCNVFLDVKNRGVLSYGLKHFSSQCTVPSAVAARDFLGQDLTAIMPYMKGFYGTDPKKNSE